MNTKTFGRRTAAVPARRVPVAAPRVVPNPALPVQATAAPVVPVAAEPIPENFTVDDELRVWKQERLQQLPSRIPWRQLYLVASLSFGIGSFALPGSVNVAADYLLWGLSAAAFVAWISGRKKPAAPTAPGPSL